MRTEDIVAVKRLAQETSKEMDLAETRTNAYLVPSETYGKIRECLANTNELTKHVVPEDTTPSTIARKATDVDCDRLRTEIYRTRQDLTDLINNHAGKPMIRHFDMGKSVQLLDDINELLLSGRESAPPVTVIVAGDLRQRTAGILDYVRVLLFNGRNTSHGMDLKLLEQCLQENLAVKPHTLDDCSEALKAEVRRVSCDREELNRLGEAHDRLQKAAGVYRGSVDNNHSAADRHKYQTEMKMAEASYFELFEAYHSKHKEDH